MSYLSKVDQMLTSFKYWDINLEIVHIFNFLEYVFQKMDHSILMWKNMWKDYVFVIGKYSNNNMSNNCKLYTCMFDKIVKPIILYECEVWDR